MKNALWTYLLEVMFWRNASPTGLACTILISKCEHLSVIVESEKVTDAGRSVVIANEATELRSEFDSVANYNAAQCKQNLSNSA